MATTATTAIVAAPAAAQTASVKRSFDIPAQSLAEALMIFGRQAGLQLTAEAAVASGKTSAAVKGDMAPAEALSRLLTGTGLTFRFVGNAGVQIEAAPVSAGNAIQLGPVRVEGQGDDRSGLYSGRNLGIEETATGPVDGFVAHRTATATKTDTPILEVPQSLSVVTRDELDARGVNSITEALRYVPGVMPTIFGQDDRGVEWFNIRGFSNAYTANYLDGLREPGGGSGYIVFQNEPYGLERIEILRGPSSVGYGQTDVGGVVSRISKRPQLDGIHEIELQLGNYGRQQIAADFGNGLGDSGNAAYRLVALGLSTKPQNDFPGYREDRTKRVYVAPSFWWKPTDSTEILFLADYLNIDATNNATEYVGADGKRTKVLVYEPSFNDLHQQQFNVGYQFSQRISQNWTFRQNLRTSWIDADFDAALGDNGTADAAGELPRYALSFRQSMRYTVIDTNLTGTLTTGPISHKLLFGVDWQYSSSDSRRLFGAAPSLNIFNPVYGQAIAAPDFLFLDSRDTQKQLGFYVQDQMALGEHLRTTVAVRRDIARSRTLDRLNDLDTRTKDSATTVRVGVNYVTSSGFAPYASYTESFLPEVGTDFFGNRFQPTRGRQYEVGLRYQPASGRALFSAALFDLQKSNVQNRDPDHQFFTIQTGAVRSRGLELEAKQEILPSLNLLAQYTYLDSKIVADNDNRGNRAANVPTHMASAWLDYHIDQGALAGLSSGLGLRYVGKSFADPANTKVNVASALIDLSLGYQLASWRLALTVNNLFDKDYLGNADGYPASRRTAVLSLKYRW